MALSGSKSRSILFTSLFLSARTGSELHIVELAKAFKVIGWDVTCYSLLITYPLQKDLEDAGIKLVEFGDEGRLEPAYDVLFAQHHLVSDFVWHASDIRFGTVVVSILGLGEMELLPSFASEADLILFVSEEALRAHLGDGPSASNARVFPNYATEPFFNAWSSDAIAEGASPRRVAVVSNHVPDELVGLREVCGEDAEIDLFGFEGTAVEITPQLLGSYDLVVTIGRTVQCCMAEGVPCYCYDRFGGPGYLLPADISVHASFNFSGRSCPTKRTSSELWADITEGYEEAVRARGELRGLAETRWSFDALFASLVEDIDSLTPVDHAHDHGDKASCFIYALACRLYREELLKETDLAQFYWTNDGNEGLSEEDSTIIRYRYNTEVDVDVDSLLSKVVDGIDRNGSALGRFDPSFHPCSCRVEGIGVILEPDDRDSIQGDWDIFYSNDPRYWADDVRGGASIRFCVRAIPSSEAISALRSQRDGARREFEEARSVEEDTGLWNKLRGLRSGR